METTPNVGNPIYDADLLSSFPRLRDLSRRLLKELLNASEGSNLLRESALQNSPKKHLLNTRSPEEACLWKKKCQKMEPDQEQHQLEALPANASPKLGGHPDNVSEDQVNSSCRSPPDSVDCITSSSEVQVGNNCTSSSSLTVDRAYAASQLLEVLPPNFKYICEIRMVQKPQEGISPLNSLESTRGLDKREEPILSPEDSTPIGTLQHHQVGLEGDTASLTSGHRIVRKTTRKVNAAKEDDLSPKINFGTVIPSSFKFTCGPEKQEVPILRPEDFRSTGTSQHYRVGLEEDAAHVRCVTGKNRKRTKGSGAEEEPPAKRTRENQAEDDLPSKSTRDSGDEEELPTKKPRACVAEEEFPAKRTMDSGDGEEERSAKRTRENQAEDDLPSKKTRDSGDGEEEISAKRYEDPVLSSHVLSPSGGTVHADSCRSSPVLSQSSLTYLEDSILSPRFGSSPTMSWEDTIMISPVLSPSLSPSTYARDTLWSSSEGSVSGGTEFWMGSDEDIEEDPIPSTSDGITGRERSRPLWFRPRYYLSSDSD